LRKKGHDPFDVGVQYAHKEELRQSFLKRIHQVIKKTRPGSWATTMSAATTSTTSPAIPDGRDAQARG
jgi:hypothetical protein